MKYKGPRSDKGHVTLLLCHNTLTQRETVSWASSGWGMPWTYCPHVTFTIIFKSTTRAHRETTACLYLIYPTQHSSSSSSPPCGSHYMQPPQTENSQATVLNLGHPCNSCMPGCGTHPHFHLKSPWLRNRHHPWAGKPLNWPAAHNCIQTGHMYSYPRIHVCSFAAFNARTISSAAFA